MKIMKISQKTKEMKIETTFPTWFHKQILEYTKNWTENLPLSQSDTNVITEWAYAVKPDLTNINLQEAFTMASDWKIEEERKEAIRNYKTHDIVYKFKDGWEIVKLSYDDIDPENDLMGSADDTPIGAMDESQYSQHQFIGDSYISGDKVETKMKEGEYIIYSLRDPDNYPHATIEMRGFNKNNYLEVLQIFAAGSDGLKKVTEKYWTEYRHPEEAKVSEFLEWLKTQGYKFLPVGDSSGSTINIASLAETSLKNDYGIPLSFWEIGGDEDNYYKNLVEAYQEGISGAYWYHSKPEKTVDALIQYAINNDELNLLQQAVEGYSIKTKNKEGKEYTQYKGLQEWANEAWFEYEMYTDFENPRPEEEDYPDKEDFMLPPDIPEGQKEFQGMPEAQPRFDEEAYNEAIKEWNEVEKEYEAELSMHQENFEPFEFEKYVYNELQKALETQRKEEPEKEISKKKQMTQMTQMTTKMYKIAKEEIPDAKTLALYTETLKSYLRDIPDLDEQIVELIKSLPSPKKIKRDFSIKECELLFESIGYVWKKITGQKLIQENEIINPPESLLGNYWLINNGILLHGVNHYGIIKKNATLICALLNINGFALQEYLSSKPCNLIKFIIDNGGIRIFVNKDKKLYAQMSPETYGKWGRDKIKKYDFKLKAVKVIDSEAPYNGWKSGITIKL